MKQRLLQFGIALVLSVGLLGGLSSCVRTYTCKCDVSYEGQPGLPNPTSKEYEIKDTNKNAKQKCSAASSKKTVMGITTIEACDLF